MSKPQLEPVKPDGQEQEKEPKLFTHIPPFMQGFVPVVHSSTSTVQNSPVYSGGQRHSIPVGKSMMLSPLLPPLACPEDMSTGVQVPLLRQTEQLKQVSKSIMLSHISP